MNTRDILDIAVNGSKQFYAKNAAATPGGALEPDMGSRLAQWGEIAGFVPDEPTIPFTRGNSDAKKFVCSKDVQNWLIELEKAGKWGVAFGIHCYNDCNNTHSLLTGVDWGNEDYCDGVIYMDSDMFRAYSTENADLRYVNVGLSKEDEIKLAEWLLRKRQRTQER